MTCKRKTLLFTAGTIWFAIGLYLMLLGMRFLETSLAPNSISPCIDFLQASLNTSRDIAVVAIVATALALGQVKGRTVLTKAAIRESDRILMLPEPAPIKHLYSKRFYILMVVMMSLGISLKLFDVPLDIRGGIDLLIGVALIQGAVTYFKKTAVRHAHL